MDTSHNSNRSQVSGINPRKSGGTAPPASASAAKTTLAKMKSHVVIFNRSALQSADGWIHIVPKGELPNREAGIVQVLDDASLDSILAGIGHDQQRLGDKWPGIYAGREHFIYHADQDSAALAWFKDFQKRDDGIWARADGLTPMGGAAIKNREYKFTSFVADRSDLQKIEGNKYRVLKIETVGFTNQANGKELLTPITNRTGTGAENNFASARVPAANQTKTNHAKTMNQIITKLGLADGADEDVVLAEITRLLNRGDITPAALTTLQNRAATLAAENQTLLGEQMDGILAEHKITDAKVINRLRPILAPLPNRAERVAFLTELGLKPDAKEERPMRVLNRGGSHAVAATAGRADDEQSLTRKIQNRAGELQAAGMKFDTAWKQAQQEILNTR